MCAYGINYSTFIGQLLKHIVFVFLIFFLGVSVFPLSGRAKPLTVAESCIVELFNTAPNTMTFGDARVICDKKLGQNSNSDNINEEEVVGASEKRLTADQTNVLKPFTLMAHRPNYILLGSYNTQGWSTAEYEEDSGDDSITFDNVETQFQLSIKTPLAIDIFDSGVDLFTAYTVTSFWQVYNKGLSSFFRETNHEPEVWLQMRSEWEFFGFKNTVNLLGFSHQSNGQDGNLSRSWNRIYAGFGFERGNFVLFLKPWIRIKEDFEDDDNPDITDYLGHGQLGMVYKYGDHNFSMMSRNNLESGFSRGAIELACSFPLFHYDFLKGYVQYFTGYGDSLIDYDQYVNRIGIGLLLTDIL